MKMYQKTASLLLCMTGVLLLGGCQKQTWENTPEVADFSLSPEELFSGLDMAG